MKNNKTVLLAIITVFAALHARAQNQSGDVRWAFNELSQMRKASMQPSRQVRINIKNDAVPISSVEDTMQTNVEIALAKDYFYFRGEGLEYILKDSLQVNVNAKTKHIEVYTTTPERIASFSGATMQSFSDSSFKRMEAKYNCTVSDTNKNRVLQFTSKEMMAGTKLPKETLTILYDHNTYQPLQIRVSTLKLVVIDSVAYHHLANTFPYKDRLIKTTSDKGSFFFLAKEKTQTSRYSFASVSSPIRWAKISERVRKTGEGVYAAARGYENYQVSNYTDL